MASTRILARNLAKFRPLAVVTSRSGANLQASLPGQGNCVSSRQHCFSSRISNNIRHFSVNSGVFQERKFAQSHEWVEVSDNTATVGISDHAQDSLGDVVYVQLPEVGDRFQAGDEFGSIESVKAASDLFCPVTGEVTETNKRLDEKPQLVNESCYGEGWIMKLKVKDASLDGLMSQEQYDEFLRTLE